MTDVNGWFPAVYMSCMSQNFCMFHVSNLHVLKFRFFLPMYPWTEERAGTIGLGGRRGGPGWTGRQRGGPVIGTPYSSEEVCTVQCGTGAVHIGR